MAREEGTYRAQSAAATGQDRKRPQAEERADG